MLEMFGGPPVCPRSRLFGRFGLLDQFLIREGWV